MPFFEWVIIRDHHQRDIGAVGFIDSRAVIIVAFYDDADANKDRELSFAERAAYHLSPVSMRDSALVEVALAARTNPEVLGRDIGFSDVALDLFMNFTRGALVDAAYAAYLSASVGNAAAPVAGRLASDLVRQYVIRKGMEAAVHHVFNTVVQR